LITLLPYSPPSEPEGLAHSDCSGFPNICLSDLHSLCPTHLARTGSGELVMEALGSEQKPGHPSDTPRTHQHPLVSSAVTHPTLCPVLATVSRRLGGAKCPDSNEVGPTSGSNLHSSCEFPLLPFPLAGCFHSVLNESLALHVLACSSVTHPHKCDLNWYSQMSS
jgi:hypothetical protein